MRIPVSPRLATSVQVGDGGAPPSGVCLDAHALFISSLLSPVGIKFNMN